MEKLYPMLTCVSTKKITSNLNFRLVVALLATSIYLQAQEVPANCNFLNKIGGAASANGAEISAYDPVSKRVYTVAGPVVEYYSLSNTGSLTLKGTLPFGFDAPSGTNVVPNSVAYKNGIVAASFALVNATTNAQNPGRVTLYEATTGNVLKTLEVGYLPDMITFTSNGKSLLTANEGEPNGYGQPGSFDPEGSVSIIDLSAGPKSATVKTATISAFNSQVDALRAAGVRIYGPNATVAQDIEPEYIAISPDDKQALVTLQENNALGIVDIATATIMLNQSCFVSRRIGSCLLNKSFHPSAPISGVTFV